jgi:two-component system response regulator HydG
MKKILIVEDDISFGLMLETWFKKNGYDAYTVPSFDRAKFFLNKTSVDLLLTDLRLPDGSGIDLLQWKNDQNFNFPCILMTSYAEIHIAVEAIKLGAFDFLEKPIEPAVLRKKVTSALDKFIEKEQEQLFEKDAEDRKTLALFNSDEEKQKIIAAIKRSAGNKTLAAKILGIDRKTLYNKIHQYDLDL